MLSLNLLNELEQGVIRVNNGGRIKKESPTELKWSPYYHGSIGIWNGGSWSLITPTTTSGEVLFDLTSDKDINGADLIADKHYDVYASYLTDDVFELCLVPWSSVNARGYGLSSVENVSVFSSDAEGRKKRYLGAVRTVDDSGVKFMDSETQRFVVNWVNRIPRTVKTYNTGTGNWSHSLPNAWKENRYGTDQLRGEFLYLWSSETIFGENMIKGITQQDSNVAYYHALTLNSWDSPSAGIYSWAHETEYNYISPSTFHGTPVLGYNFITQLIYVSKTKNWNDYGDCGLGYLVLRI